MQLSNLLAADDEDRAVSPVIGVILMVAITVILAAVIGTFVLGLGDQVQTTAPNANFAFDYSAGDEDLTITHDGGDGISGDELYLRGDVNRTGDAASWLEAEGIDTVRAGDGTSVGNTTSYPYQWDGADHANATVRVVWESSDSDQSSTLRTWSSD